jgi:hypothetical protein
MQSPYTYVWIVTGQKYVTNCDFHRFNTSILLSLHTICRFRLRCLSFSHEHEILIFLRISVPDVALRGAELRLYSAIAPTWVYFTSIGIQIEFISSTFLILLWNSHLRYNNRSWHWMHITPLHNVLVTDGFLQNFVRASYHYRPHSLFACCLRITKIVTWGPWKLARYH